MSRKSPCKSANLFQVGYRQQGNDGNMWMNVEITNKKGKSYNRWQKVGNKPHNTDAKVKIDRILENGINELPKKVNAVTSIPESTRKNVPGSYRIHGRQGYISFLVTVSSTHKVQIFRRLHDERLPDHDDEMFESVPCMTVDHSITVFIGDSRGDVYGQEFTTEGTTILIELKNNVYIYVKESIKVFQLVSQIVSYTSDNLDDDEPAPVGMDIQGKLYLFDEQVVLDSMETNEEHPLIYFWDRARIYQRIVPKINNIIGFYFDSLKKMSPLRFYTPKESVGRAKKGSNHIKDFIILPYKKHQGVKFEKSKTIVLKPIFAAFADGTRKELTPTEFIQLMDIIGKNIGISYMRTFSGGICEERCT
jgi:hypothetical protein